MPFSSVVYVTGDPLTSADRHWFRVSSWLGRHSRQRLGARPPAAVIRRQQLVLGQTRHDPTTSFRVLQPIGVDFLQKGRQLINVRGRCRARTRLGAVEMPSFVRQPRRRGIRHNWFDRQPPRGRRRYNIGRTAVGRVQDPWRVKGGICLLRRRHTSGIGSIISSRKLHEIRRRKSVRTRPIRQHRRQLNVAAVNTFRPDDVIASCPLHVTLLGIDSGYVHSFFAGRVRQRLKTFDTSVNVTRTVSPIPINCKGALIDIRTDRINSSTLDGCQEITERNSF